MRHSPQDAQSHLCTKLTKPQDIHAAYSAALDNVDETNGDTNDDTIMNTHAVGTVSSTPLDSRFNPAFQYVIEIPVILPSHLTTDGRVLTPPSPTANGSSMPKSIENVSVVMPASPIANGSPKPKDTTNGSVVMPSSSTVNVSSKSKGSTNGSLTLPTSSTANGSPKPKGTSTQPIKKKIHRSRPAPARKSTADTSATATPAGAGAEASKTAREERLLLAQKPLPKYTFLPTCPKVWLDWKNGKLRAIIPSDDDVQPSQSTTKDKGDSKAAVDQDVKKTKL